MTDSFIVGADGAAWVSQMGSATGGSPGRIARIGALPAQLAERPWPLGAAKHESSRPALTAVLCPRFASHASLAGSDFSVLGEFPATPDPDFNPHGSWHLLLLCTALRPHTATAAGSSNRVCRSLHPVMPLPCRFCHQRRGHEDGHGR